MKTFSGSICYRLSILFTYFFLLSPAYASADLDKSPVESSFLSELEEYSYPSLPDPQEAQLLRWDFSENKIYAYDYSQKVVTTRGNDDIFKGGTDSMESTGKLSLKSEKDHLARFVLEDVTMSMELPSSKGEEPKEMKVQNPPVVVQDVKEDGSMKLNDSSQALLIKLLFPLPQAALKVGEEISTPTNMPFSAVGSMLYVTGTITTKLTELVRINGKRCARIETIIDISKMDIPEELKGDYNCQVRGKSVFFFNLEDRYFIEGKLAMVMNMSVEAPMPGMTISEEKKETGMPDKIRTDMISDNYISVSFIEN